MAEPQDKEPPSPQPSDAPQASDDVFELAGEVLPKPPRPAAPARAPLPRTWRAEPEPTKRPDKRAKAGQSSEGDGPKGVLAEKTPVLDTIEARRTARILMSILGLVLCLIVGFVLVRIVTSGASRDASEEDLLANSIPAVDRARMEGEAQTLYDRARDVATHGDSDLAISLLKRVTSAYAGTRAAVKAHQALERPHQNQPLFPESQPETVGAAATKAEVKSNASHAGAKETGTAPSSPPAPRVATTSPPPLPAPDAPAIKAEEPLALKRPEVARAEPAPRPLPTGFRARPDAGVHSSGWPLKILCERDDATMVLVPGGTFLMGRDEGEPAEQPAHRVTVATFYIDQDEVTVRRFATFEKERGRRTDRARALARAPTPPDTSEDMPVVMVNAREAKDYADWAGKRLPTEAQWEMAARGTDGRPHPWGWGPPPWEKRRTPRQIDPIRSFPADVSPCGAFDMAGNAWEWTKDWFDPRYFQLFRNQAAGNPTGPSIRPHTLQLTVKGSSKSWIVTSREGIKFDVRLPYLGFRCVLPVEGPDSRPAPTAPSTVPSQGNATVPF